MSTHRRAFGSINQRGNSIRITYPGCRAGESLPRGSTAKDAEKLLARRRRERELGTWIEPDHMTVADYLDAWLEVRHEEGILPSTLRHYQGCVARLKPLVGSVKLQALTRLHVESARSKLRAGLKAVTVNKTLDAGRVAFNYAIEHELLAKNPFATVKRLTKQRYEPHPLDPEQAQRYLDVALGQDIMQPYGRLLAVLLLTLKRKGEVLALQWKDVDLDARTAHINGVMQEDGTIRRTASNKLKLATIRLLPQAVGLLREQYEWQRQRLGVVGPDGTVDLARLREQSEWLVWTNSAGDNVGTTSLREAHKRVLRLAGLDEETTIHDLRHTGVSLLIARGARPKDIQELCGHSTIQITMNTYGHIFPGDLLATLELLGDTLKVRTREAG